MTENPETLWPPMRHRPRLATHVGLLLSIAVLGGCQNKLAAERAKELILELPAYQEGAVQHCTVLESLMPAGDTTRVSTLDATDTACVQHLAAMNLVTLGECTRESYGLGCVERRIAAQAPAVPATDLRAIFVPCGRVEFGEIDSVTTLENRAEVTYHYTQHRDDLSNLNPCTVNWQGVPAAGRVDVEKNFLRDDDGNWRIDN